MTIFEQLLSGGLFMAVIGCYIYIGKVASDMKTDQKDLEDCVEGALKENSKAVNELALVVTNRLTAIETQLGIQLPKKGAGGSHSE